MWVLQAQRMAEFVNERKGRPTALVSIGIVQESAQLDVPGFSGP